MKVEYSVDPCDMTDLQLAELQALATEHLPHLKDVKVYHTGRFRVRVIHRHGQAMLGLNPAQTPETWVLRIIKALRR